MIKQKTKRWTFILCSTVVFVLAAALFFCLSMVKTINSQMDESAISNLLNMTLVIVDTFESYIESNYDSLNVVGTVYANDGMPKTENLLAFCKTMEFDWLGIVDADGNGADCFGNKYQMSEYPAYYDWDIMENGYSNAYIGQRSGRPQITIWVPVYKDEEYIGTVLGNIIMTQYYSANLFTFSDGAGRTYIFNGTDGTWILKSLGTDGTSTRNTDIYSLLASSENKTEDINKFRKTVNEGKSGAAVFNFNGECSFLCFMPMPSSPGWYVTTVIAKDTLLRESSEVQRMIGWVLAILCTALAFSAVVFAAWLVRKTKIEEVQYREALFANISANLDSAFLIYEKGVRKTAFVSDNINRLLGLNREWLSENAGHLFDWCSFAPDDLDRLAFLEGTLDKPVVREICMKNELGENARTIRLELIPTNMGQELAVLTDITSDKEIQSSLIEAMERTKAASNAKNSFLSVMSHDLRTPINGVVGMTAIAMANLDDKNRVQDCLNKISESTEHLLSLINEVLDMSQFESGKIELASEAFNIAELLQEVVNINYPGFQQKNHTVKVCIHFMEHEEVIGDTVCLTRIVSNLISNAIKYTPSGGTIKLTLQEKEPMIHGYGCYELVIQDNGIGISSQFQEKLFEPFEREDEVRLGRIQGTGLGLSIVKNMVELMMGSIQVESEKGKGSIFRVTINLMLNECEKSQESQLADLPVLVVNNDFDDCKMVAEILCSIGMKGEYTIDNAQAIAMAAERHQKKDDYFAVLLDWNIGDTDIMEVARRIRAEVGSLVSLIVLTDFELGEIEAKAREAGIDSFMSKPIYKAKLLRKMTEIINGRLKASKLPDLFSVGNIPSGKRVLLAEDNELNREIAVELLRMLGVEVDCADNGEAVAKIFADSEPGKYDLILMDIQMPIMNGYDATRKIRNINRPDAQTIPIVAMTADAFKKDEQATHEAGMNAHLAKPISVERLSETLKSYLSN